MEQEEQMESEESPEYTEWVRREVAIGMKAADCGDFYKGTLNDLKAEV
jgi:hypothetical protein